MKFLTPSFLLLALACLLKCTCAARSSENKQSVGPTSSVQNYKPVPDLTAASSVAVRNFKLQSVAPRTPSSSSSPSVATPNRGYGYPYRIAPTLGPAINARSDDENEAAAAQPKPFGSKLGLSGDPLKKSSPKKYKAPFAYGATRRTGYMDEDVPTSTEKRFRTYKEPKYRNFDALEKMFLPRRIDTNIPYSEFDYSPKSSRRPLVSPRDPYLSPSDAPSDSFYPTVPKLKSYTSYAPRGPAYGAGRYEDPYHDDVSHDSFEEGGYEGPSKYPPSGGHFEYQEDYAIESNKPIIGDIRKKLLDYAGASDLYEGEPDYLEEIARNKKKYGHVANDYYAYGRPEYRNSYRDFPYVESKVRILKKPRL